eukprot:3543003-Rhodomonas_salina.1
MALRRFQLPRMPLPYHPTPYLITDSIAPYPISVPHTAPSLVCPYPITLHACWTTDSSEERSASCITIWIWGARQAIVHEAKTHDVDV